MLGLIRFFCIVAFFRLLGSFSIRPTIRFRTPYVSATMTKMSIVDVQPGSPIVNKLDTENYIAYMTVAIPGDKTQKAFTKACELFNEVEVDCY